MRSEYVAYTMTDPETGAAYTFETRFHDHDVEIEVFHKDDLSANIMIDVYNGKCQLIIADKQKMNEADGDDPQIMTLFKER